MFIWGHYDRDKREDQGEFECPRCDSKQPFALIRSWRYLHIYWIPLGKQDLVKEKVVCEGCGAGFPITVLAGSAGQIASSLEAGQGQAGSIGTSIGNVIQLTDAAVDEIGRRRFQGKFGGRAVVRVDPIRGNPRTVKVTFDVPLADGRDWLGDSNGVKIVVDRAIAPDLLGATIDFADGEFVRY